MDSSIKKKLIVTGIVFASLLSVGTFGYYILTNGEYDLFTCLYMTVITVTTIGFEEAIELDNSVPLRLFTMFLAFLGIGLLTYFVSAFSLIFIEGHLRKSFIKRKMEKDLKNLEHHYIICGVGRHALHLIEELSYYKSNNVCIEIDHEVIEKVSKTFNDVYYVEGDASQDEILLKAGIQKADGIFASTSDDNLNLVICLSARRLNPKIKIVSLCLNHRNMEKIKLAGADKVISTNYIGGLRMAAEMVRPSSTNVLDIVLGGKYKHIKIDELLVSEENNGKKLSELTQSNYKNTLIIAIISDEKMIFNPDKDYLVKKSDQIIMLNSSAK